MPITFTVENVDSISMDQIREIQNFISERSKDITHVFIDLIPKDGPIEYMQLSPYVNISGPDSAQLKKPPHYKTLQKTDHYRFQKTKRKQK